MKLFKFEVHGTGEDSLLKPALILGLIAETEFEAASKALNLLNEQRFDLGALNWTGKTLVL